MFIQDCFRSHWTKFHGLKSYGHIWNGGYLGDFCQALWFPCYSEVSWPFWSLLLHPWHSQLASAMWVAAANRFIGSLGSRWTRVECMESSWWILVSVVAFGDPEKKCNFQVIGQHFLCFPLWRQERAIQNYRGLSEAFYFSPDSDNLPVPCEELQLTFRWTRMKCIEFWWWMLASVVVFGDAEIR